MSASKPQWDQLIRDSYPVTKESMSQRMALLITNKTFTNPSLNRDGAERDEKAMCDLLSLLGYQVVKHRDLSAQEIDRAIISFSKEGKLRRADSLFVVVMSHGDLGVILGKNHFSQKPDLFQVDLIYERLNNRSSPQLEGKPKIIIIQACRGHQDGAANIPRNTTDDVIDMDGLQSDALMHLEADFISLRSCTPHTVSWRSPRTGSVFICRFTEVMGQNFRRDYMDELFRKVMRKFTDYPRQMPTIERETLMKHFYLLPVRELCPAHTAVPVTCCNAVCTCRK